MYSINLNEGMSMLELKEHYMRPYVEWRFTKDIDNFKTITEQLDKYDHTVEQQLI